MKKLKQNLLIILLSLSFTTVALPPDMQADRYLVRVEKALKDKDKDYKTAAVMMDKIMALKNQHNLELPIDFYFKYAKILLKGNVTKAKADKSFAAVNYYLTATGKSGANYAEALDLYDRAIFWQLVQAQNIAKVKQLIQTGADVNANAKSKYGFTPLHFAASFKNPDFIEAFGKEVINDAINLSIKNNLDLEDTLQCLCAKYNQCDYLISADKSFIDCGIKIVNYNQFNELTNNAD